MRPTCTCAIQVLQLVQGAWRGCNRGMCCIRKGTVIKLLTPLGSHAIDNFNLFATLFDMVSQRDIHTNLSLTTKSYLPNSGELCLRDAVSCSII